MNIWPWDESFWPTSESARDVFRTYICYGLWWKHIGQTKHTMSNKDVSFLVFHVSLLVVQYKSLLNGIGNASSIHDIVRIKYIYSYTCILCWMLSICPRYHLCFSNSLFHSRKLNFFAFITLFLLFQIHVQKLNLFISKYLKFISMIWKNGH